MVVIEIKCPKTQTKMYVDLSFIGKIVFKIRILQNTMINWHLKFVTSSIQRNIASFIIKSPFFVNYSTAPKPITG